MRGTVPNRSVEDGECTRKVPLGLPAKRGRIVPTTYMNGNLSESRSDGSHRNGLKREEGDSVSVSDLRTYNVLCWVVDPWTREESSLSPT